MLDLQRSSMSFSTQLILLVGIFASAMTLTRVVYFVHLYFVRPSKLSRYSRKGKLQDNTKANAKCIRDETRAWALVTGATSGVGLAFTHELAARGFNVILHGRNPTKLSDKIEALTKKFPGAAFRQLVANAGDTEAVQSSVNRLSEDLETNLPGPLTILINNVGGANMEFPFLTLDEHTPADIDSVISLNARFTTLLTHALLPLLARNTPSLLLCTGSQTGVHGMPYLTVYSGCKGYLRSWTEGLALEFITQRLDIEIMCLVLGGTTDTSGFRLEEESFWMPAATAVAKSGLDRVGCGKATVHAHWSHAAQHAIAHSFPSWTMKLWLPGVMNSLVQDAKEKAQEAENAKET